MGGEYELGGKFVPKKVPILKFLQKNMQILKFFPHICASFDSFYQKIHKFWQFLPKKGERLEKASKN